MTVQRMGFWLSIFLIIGTVAYFCLVTAAAIVVGLPPGEPFQSWISAVTYISVPFMVLLWVTIHETMPGEKKVYSLGSLVLVIIFATLTSINRYTALTVVPQAIVMGKTSGLEWFQPYGWPSIMAAMEVQAWGVYLGLAFLWLAPAFRLSRPIAKQYSMQQANFSSGLEKAIFFTLLVSGVLCLLAALGQVVNSIPLNILGVAAWGPGLITLLSLLTVWFRKCGTEAKLFV